MKYLIAVFLIYLSFLLWERYAVNKARKSIKHIVHVNGTRGKSSVTRLIGAGLSAGGYRVLTKTTGTIPTIILPDGREEIIIRHSPSNIKEQVKTLLRAGKEKADILVIECMALRPEYQNITQHKILSADIGVITNIRLDHTEIMGNTLPEIAKCIANTVPKNGVVFTAEEKCSKILKEETSKNGSSLTTVKQEEFEISVDFAENYSLALAVCGYLSVEKDKALEGMVNNYIRDPYALEYYNFKMGAHLIAGLSINDKESTKKAYYSSLKKLDIENKRLVLLINNRADRGARTLQMAEIVKALNPVEIWILGSGGIALKRKILSSNKFDAQKIKTFKSAREITFSNVEAGCVIYAVGNLGEQGTALMDIVRAEGERIEL